MMTQNADDKWLAYWSLKMSSKSESMKVTCEHFDRIYTKVYYDIILEFTTEYEQGFEGK
jgi:hypothetical protein